MWKFKTSKYKNAAAKIPKKEEWITGISASNLPASFGSHIQASAAYIAFNQDVAGGSTIGFLPVNGEQKRFTSGSLPTIQAHSDYVTDIEFCPFDDYILATASQDCLVKLWSLPNSLDDITNPICNPLCTVAQESARIEVIRWNPVIENVLCVASGSGVKVYDTVKQAAVSDISDCHGDQVQCISWSDGGTLLASTCKDKKLRIIDGRTGIVTQTVDSHTGLRESRCLWLGDGKDFVLTTGFNSIRQRELIIRDTRNLTKSLKTASYDNSTGSLIPLYDSDTGMLFLAGKGDVSVRYTEISDKDPYLTENSIEMVEQMKGAALLPKRAVDVMNCEVNRLYILTQNSILPLPYHVPRKSMRDFQSDLYPDTYSGVPICDCDAWLTNDSIENLLVTKISLDPVSKSQLILKRSQTRSADVTFAASAKPAAAGISDNTAPAAAAVESAAANDLIIVDRAASNLNDTEDRASNQTDTKDNRNGKCKPTIASSKPNITSAKPSQGGTVKSTAVFTGVNQSKFRHIECIPLKMLYIENIRNIARTVPGESDLFHANTKYCAVPLNGPGGLIAILLADRPGRLPDSGLPTVQNSSPVCDFMWDPFNDDRLIVGCEDAKIRIWEIPSIQFMETVAEPAFYLIGHSEKIYFVKFHPTARDILASGSYDMTVRIWNLSTQQLCIVLKGHTDTIFSFAWSLNGGRCATSSKDGQIRIYDPRASSDPISTGKSLEGSRGGRIVWACNDSVLAVTGFDRASVRQIALYSCINDEQIASLVRIDLDTSPAILVPHYDPDTSVIYLTGRGDGTIRMFEISSESPYLLPLTDYKAEGLHQALAVLAKCVVDVKEVEINRAFRLTNSAIEPISFRVPRVKKDFFQDDIYKAGTCITWEPRVSAEQWLSGEDGQSKTISLKPADMIPLSEAPVEEAKPRKYENFHEYSVKYKSDEQKKEELITAMTNKLNLDDGPLPQDLTEGVDPDEWDD